MRVNNINSNLNFKRVIPIDYIPNKQAKNINGVDEAFMEIQDILNSTEPFFYSKAESEKIRQFFKEKIEDYNGKNGVIFTKANGRTFLITGDDTKYIKSIKNELSKKNIVAKSLEEKEQVVMENRRKLAIALSKKAEDGSNGKPDTLLSFVSNARTEARDTDKTLSKQEVSRFDAIKYQYTYSSNRPQKFKDTIDKKAVTSFRTEIFDKGVLEI